MNTLFPPAHPPTITRTHHVGAQEVTQLLGRDPEVGVGEGVRNVPPEGAEEAALLHNCVEETQGEGEATEPL